MQMDKSTRSDAHEVMGSSHLALCSFVRGNMHFIV
jgi:hypothetical protein